MKALIFALLLLPSAANAWTGSEMLKYCTAEPGDATGFEDMSTCQGFVLGAIQMDKLSAGWGYKPRPFICEPAGTTLGQHIKIYVKFLNANPEQLHVSGVSSLVNALRRVFPCEG